MTQKPSGIPVVLVELLLLLATSKKQGLDSNHGCPTKTCFVITTAYKRVLPTNLQLGLITTKKRDPLMIAVPSHYAYLKALQYTTKMTQCDKAHFIFQDLLSNKVFP